MRSHVLNWLWLCFAFFCSVKPIKAGTRVNHSFYGTSAEITRYQPSVTNNVNFQQKDTTVKPTTSPVVITPASSGKKDTTKPATASPVVVTPSSDKKDTTKPASAAPVVVTPSSDTSRPKKDSSANSRTAADTTSKPKKDTALILPADSNKLKQEASQFNLKGIVKEAGGTPIPGAQVVNLSTKEAVATTADGAFTLKASLGDTIKIAAVSYAEQSIPLDSREQLNVSLTSASANQKALKEVVVTALGIQKNTRAVGYAVEEVGGNAVQEAKEVNFANALTGKVPGLQINTNTGSMGGSTKITIRGVKSILGDNNAFILVDGTPFINNNTNQGGQLNGGGGYDFGSSLQDINPEDIDNISVLKGAAATALYGSRGANGVMLITTKKRPDVSGGIGVTYSINAQVDRVYVLPKYQNEYGGGTGGKFDTLYYNQNPEAFIDEAHATYDNNDGKGRYDLLVKYYDDASWGPKLDGQLVRHYWSWDKNKGNPYFGQTAPWTANPNNVKDFYRTGYTLTNNIAMAGNNDKGYFRLSYGNMNQIFVLPNASLNRNNLSFNGGHELTKGLRAVASLNYTAMKAKARPGTGFTGPNPTLQFTMYGQRQLDIEQEKRYQYEDGSQITWNRKSWNDPAVASSNGPYWNRYMDYETDSRNRIFGNAGLDWDVSKWLTISGRVFMDDYNTLEEERTAKDYLIGSYIKRVRTSREMNYQLTANINKEFGKDFKLNALVGGNIMHRKWTTTGGSTVGGLIIPGVYNLNNSLQTALPIDEFFEKQINSAFATASLGYRNFLFLELTGRADWSSALLSENNPYFYPSASASFVFSDLLKDWKWLSFGKLRASVSQVGSDTDPYQIYDTYQFIPPFGSFPATQLTSTKYNKTLKPERTREYETGISLKFLDDHIGLDVTYYDRITKDQIIPLPISSASGFTNTIVNGGSVQNRGLEIGLNLNPVRLKNGFRWDINANIARNRNKLLNLDIPQYNSSLPVLLIGTDRRTTRVSVAAYVGKPMGTLLGTDYVYDAQGRKIVGSDGLYKTTNNPVPIGNAYPDYVGGVTNSFTYKGVYLSALVDFQHGGDFFSYTNMYGKGSGLLDITAANGVREKGIIAEGVTEEGRPNEVVLDAATYFQNNEGKTLSKANLYDASYIYLREVKLGYNLPEAWFKKVHAQSARLSLYGRNLWLIKSNAPNVDPSNILNSSSNIQGIEGGALPSLRSYGVNLSVSF
ncbi:SusC/RagA family TonB-linked outer membrane protein [Chitinophaga filiformis]|uniref:SusC/RagA family TonB-linked outer membrane protein n=1 Tax=Chitinophaga filiformis TaxID=104663 RepID=A0ABY4I2J6_CHIFI|nr:SusC/RagA family TonB-linked outer membrane protein [Chitinophaga filiformis]UPK70047.1 SusC/RagA family TonB-linked outer membrane protein [Chitinophaga filiformis]